MAQVTMDHLDIKTEKLDFKKESKAAPESFPSLSVIISQNRENHSQSFFCNMEAQIEKNTKFLVRFRLGSVDYVDQLEGKRNY